MKIQNIYTDRYFETWPSWQLVYEWEDVFASSLNISLIDSRKAAIVSKLIDRILTSLSRRLKLADNGLLKFADLFSHSNKALYFEMFQKGAAYRFSTGKNTIPYIIDFWEPQDLNVFYKTYANSALVLISSKEVYEYLKEKQCPLNIQHLPLSIPDKYKIDLAEDTVKEYDIIFAGRTSSVFWDYLQEYLKTHPDTEYLYPQHIDNQIHFASNKKGIIGNYHNREDYMKLLRSVRVAFYSTPGIDDTKKSITGNFSQVTPKLFEIAAAGCSVLARYPKNADTDFYRLPYFYPSINNYSVFEQQLQKALGQDAKEVWRYNKEFLKAHYTSERAQLLTQILNKNQ